MKQDATIIVDVTDTQNTWCVYEHLVTFDTAQPPETIYIGACKLFDLFRMVDARTNTEWRKIFANGGAVMVRVVETMRTKADAIRSASRLVFEHQPRCNIQGFADRYNHHAVRCLENGTVYRTQTAAAADLGIHASSISRHLAGHLRTAQGFRFEYAPTGGEKSNAR